MVDTWKSLVMNDETQHIMHAHVHNNHNKLHVVDDGGQQPFPVRKGLS